MAKLSKIAQAKRLAVKPKFKVRAYNRCGLCGRPRAFLKKFQMCRMLQEQGVERRDHGRDQVVVVKGNNRPKAELGCGAAAPL
jgi:ribosomal protein S14